MAEQKEEDSLFHDNEKILEGVTAEPIEKDQELDSKPFDPENIAVLEQKDDNVILLSLKEQIKI